MKKYKPCCSNRCLLGNCETRDDGGCYCLCRLKDSEHNLMNVLEGRTCLKNGLFIYSPNIIPKPIEGEEKEKIEKRLQDVRDKIKEYLNDKGT